MIIQSQVTIKTLNQGQERHIWFVFESDHENLEHVYEELADDGVIYGQRVETEHFGSGGKRRAVRRYECILTKEALVSITPLQFELVEDREPEVVR